MWHHPRPPKDIQYWTPVPRTICICSVPPSYAAKEWRRRGYLILSFLPPASTCPTISVRHHQLHADHKSYNISLSVFISPQKLSLFCSVSPQINRKEGQPLSYPTAFKMFAMSQHQYAYAAAPPAPRQYSGHGTSSAFSSSANPDEDWTKISDLAERRRIQNRIAQRNYRMCSPRLCPVKAL